MSTLGKRIQELRKNAGLTQQELAAKIKISHPQIVRYETKDVQPPADVLKKLADVLNVSIDFLVNGDTNEKVRQSLKDVELINQFKAVEKLPEEKRVIIKDLIDAYLFRTNIQQQLAH